MTTEDVRFHSGPAVLAGTLKLPDAGSPPFPAIVQGPGWLGLAAANA